jgi:tripartite-type tricarboxylate transporter receptor subunit TctC
MTGRLLCAAGALLMLAGAAHGETFPSRAIQMVIPFAAGGPTDLLGRVMAERMSQSLGQPVVVENVTGAGGMLGTQKVAQAKPDGYTFVLGTVGTHAVNQTLYKKPLYNAAADFEPVALVAEVPLVLITRKDLPPTNLQEFVAYAKANQAKMNFGSAGNGSAVHLGCLLLNATIGTDVQHVPYRGSAPATQDLVGGQIDFMCDIVSTALPQIQAKAVKALAMLSKTRAASLPDVPTAEEQGLKDFEAYTWNAFFYPKGTPGPIVARLREATLDAMHAPSVKQRFDDLSISLVSDDKTTPDYLRGFVTSEIEKWAAPIKASGVTVD